MEDEWVKGQLQVASGPNEAEQGESLSTPPGPLFSSAAVKSLSLERPGFRVGAGAGSEQTFVDLINLSTDLFSWRAFTEDPEQKVSQVP